MVLCWWSSPIGYLHFVQACCLYSPGSPRRGNCMEDMVALYREIAYLQWGIVSGCNTLRASPPNPDMRFGSSERLLNREDGLVLSKSQNAVIHFWITGVKLPQLWSEEMCYIQAGQEIFLQCGTHLAPSSVVILGEESFIGVWSWSITLSVA
jgi:hypothetical protein